MTRLSPPTIVFVRHGRTDWNVNGRLLGQQDIPLNDAGRADARHNGATIKVAVPDVATFDFVASPLSRARETMEIVRAAIGLDPEGYRTDPSSPRGHLRQVGGPHARRYPCRHPGRGRCPRARQVGVPAPRRGELHRSCRAACAVAGGAFPPDDDRRPRRHRPCAVDRADRHGSGRRGGEGLSARQGLPVEGRRRLAPLAPFDGPAPLA